MPKLDTMLQALADRKAGELRLADGHRPVFRFPDGDRPVSQTALNRAQIVTLMSELSGLESATKLQAGENVRFVYELPDGTAFECEVGASGGALEARLVPRAVESAAPAITERGPGSERRSPAPRVKLHPPFVRAAPAERPSTPTCAAWSR